MTTMNTHKKSGETSFQPYPAYKPSGIDWLGDIPAHWDVRRLKAVCRFAYGDTLTASMRSYGSVPVYGSNGQVGVHSTANTMSPCIVIGRKGSFGKVNYAEQPIFAIDTTYFIDERYSQNNLRWLFYALGWIRLDDVTKDSAIPGLGREDAYQRLAPIPPLPEQAAIVRYLDRADERIRRAIAAKQRLIDLLTEQRQAVIHRAVTRGIHDSAPMKPSGVEWLGDIPAHWDVRRLKWVSKNVIKAAGLRHKGELCLALEHVESWTGRIIEPVPDIQLDSQVKRFQAGDVLFGKLRPYLAKVARPDRDGVCVGEFLVLRPNRGQLRSSYLELIIRSKPVIDAIESSTYGAKMPRANWDFIGSMPLPVPPLAEQAAIARHLDKATADIDAAMENARRQVELLREYRARLIADVVTGRVDARE